MVEDLSQRLKLSFDVDLSAPRKYAVTLMRAGDTLHGWRFPAEVLRRAGGGSRSRHTLASSRTSTPPANS
jgi:hypothetical protein